MISERARSGNLEYSSGFGLPSKFSCKLNKLNLFRRLRVSRRLAPMFDHLATYYAHGDGDGDWND